MPQGTGCRLKVFGILGEMELLRLRRLGCGLAVRYERVARLLN
jgi:hypothetical protein